MTTRGKKMALCAAGVAAATAASTLVGGSLALAATPSGGTIKQITVSPSGETEGNGNGRYGPEVSNNGRYVVFWTYSPSIVADDDNGLSDVFLYDANTGVTKLISRNPAGRPGNNGSSNPVISANGKVVAFQSAATDLVTGVTNPGDRIYRYTVATGKITPVSKTTTGKRVFGVSPAISADGRYISYSSRATDIVAGDTDGREDVFRYDATLDTAVKVSRTLSGQAPDKDSYGAAMSGNGRYVAWSTNSRNMGPADTNFKVDAYLTDVDTGATRLLSHDAAGTAVGGTPTGVSDNGLIVPLYSDSATLATGDTDTLNGAFVWNGNTDQVKLISTARPEWPDGATSFTAGISTNGRYIVYSAFPGQDATQGNVYLFDRTTKQTTKITVRPDGGDANGPSGDPGLSRNGNNIGFCSNATNLVPGDNYGNCDIFEWSRTL